MLWVWIYEGESSVIEENNILGRFEVTALPPSSSGSFTVEAVFDIDSNGILWSRAWIVGRYPKIISVLDKGCLTRDEIIAIKRQWKVTGKQFQAKNELENYVYLVMKSVEDISSQISENDQKQIDCDIDAVIEWLDSNQLADADQFYLKQKEFESKCVSFMQKYLVTNQHDD
eukprot:TRINITY_DN4604_c0_g1_i1.p1 TRINITY_DN4604_c0_g1~~TRINITY_DN4604_c0_g1_i1.p1  ORF type:complete len:172 (+),score=26.41 TRINITY_DN4604_c0_g1_i1:203-718(+)